MPTAPTFARAPSSASVESDLTSIDSFGADINMESRRVFYGGRASSEQARQGQNIQGAEDMQMQARKTMYQGFANVFKISF
jgi:hypothetical protein